MKNEHQVQRHKTRHGTNEQDTYTSKLIRLVRLLARQEALEFVAKTGTIATEVQP